MLKRLAVKTVTIAHRSLLLWAIAITAVALSIAAPAPADAQSGDAAVESSAFDSAKELGTLEAWEAFLKAYPKGFYADLARAYVRKIGASPKPDPKPSKTVTTPASPVPEKPTLSTQSSSPGSTSWFTTRYEMDEGNASARAAAVKANGLELLLHCDGRNRLGAILREYDRGVYPEFDERIRQGLAARHSSRDKDGYAQIPMRFSNGSIYSVAAVVQEMNGEVSLDDNRNETGFRYDSGVVEDLMSASTVKIEAKPFSATFQLKKSRDAICSIASRCGGKAPGCTSRATVSKKKIYKKKRPRRTAKKKTFTCSAGKTWNGSQCVQNPYLDKKGRPLDGYVVDQNGNVYQDNGGGE